MSQFKVQTVCPQCGNHFEEITFGRKFLLVDGVRYTGVTCWTLDCCGAEILDGLLDWECYSDDDGDHWGCLIDKETREPVFTWREGKELDESDST